MDWDKVVELSIPAVSGLAGVGLGGYLTIWNERSAVRRREAKDMGYLAVLVVANLYDLAESCIALAYDNGTDEMGQPAGKNETLEPTLPSPQFRPLELDVDWKSIPTDLMHEVLRLPQRIQYLDREVDALWGAEGPPWFDEGFWVRQIGYARLARDVCELMAKLRGLAKLEDARPDDAKASQWSRADAKLKDLEQQREAIRRRREEAYSRHPVAFTDGGAAGAT